MLAKLFGSAVHGVDAFRITVEVSVSNGIGYQITGLPDEAIRESLSRIAVAVKNSGFFMPRNKLVINLAPADVRKTGTAFDLPITIGILLASGQIEMNDRLKDITLIGEIGLDGTIYPVRGALCMTFRAQRDGFMGIVLPLVNAREASLVKGISVFGIKHFTELITLVQNGFPQPSAKDAFVLRNNNILQLPDFRDVKSQHGAKRAMEIAAAGGHNVLLIGPPGEGKTMIAKRLPSIMPDMTLAEALETTRVYSVINHGKPLTGLITRRPFRSPHHTTSDVALTGGGIVPVPGEISLAHNGVLFLDELPEFRRSAIEVLRQPLEDRKVLISRSRMSLEFPSSFMLVAAMNPCHCGYLGHPLRACICNKRAIYWYRRKISGPLMERIDLHVEVDSVSQEKLGKADAGVESSAVIRARVVKARNIQLTRFKEMPGVHCNAHMPDSELEKLCAMEDSAGRFLLQTMSALQLSTRSYTRILRISRTIADLGGSAIIRLEHVAEAVHYRSLDKPLVIKTKSAQKE